MSRSPLPGVLFTAIVALMLASGCAVEPQKKGLEDMRLTPELVDKVQAQGKVELSGDDQVICRLEMPTGSHLAVWRCDTWEGTDARARKNQREILRSQGAPKPKIGN